jgi:iron complex transport system permease protein
LSRSAASATVILLAALAAFTPGCRGRTPPQPATAAAPQRIISFSPALTRILFDMGLGDRVVAVTSYCRLPEGVTRPRVGDASMINSEAIVALEPDLIVAQTSPAKFKGVRDLRPGVRVEEFSIERLSDIPAAIDRLGDLAGRPGLAERARGRFQRELDRVRQGVAGRRRPRVLFVMGTDRPFIAGDRTFIADMIEAAGGASVAGDIPGDSPWRQTQIDHIVTARPEVILCQVQPGRQGAAREYWRQWDDMPAARDGRVFILTEPEWSIPGTHAAKLAGRLAGMLHATAATADGGAVGGGLPLWQARVNRLIAAAIVGAALAAGGMALQGLLRNPLAEPYILGISSGAGVGVLAGLALAGRLALPEWASTPALAFVGAVVTCAVVYSVAQRRGRLDPYSLILSGVIVNTFNAAIMLTIYLYLDPYRIADFTHWAMGRLPDSPDVTALWVCGGCVALGAGALLAHGAGLNVLGLGDEVAASSGVTVQRLRLVVFVAVGLMTAAAVALAGPIGFLGLIVPHIVRMIVGSEHRLGLIVSAAAGAVFLMVAETLCRRAAPLIGVSLIPVGILTALAGGPFFIILLRRRLGKGESA